MSTFLLVLSEIVSAIVGAIIGGLTVHFHYQKTIIKKRSINKVSHVMTNGGDFSVGDMYKKE